MLLAYVDESYNDTHLFLSAMVIQDTQGVQLINLLETILKDRADDGVPHNAELHGSEMLHCHGDWRGLPPWVRVMVYQEATKAIGNVGAKTFYCGIDLAKLKGSPKSDQPPHELALSFLLEALQSYATQEQELVLVIADEIHTAERHRTRLKAHRDSYEEITGRVGLDRIFDTLYFGPSRHSRLLQAVDLLTYIYLRRTTTVEHSPRAGMANQRIWRPIAPTIVTEIMYPTE